MIKVNIITAEMNSLQGVNRMTEKFIFGKDIFEKCNIKMSRLITKDGNIDVCDYKSSLGMELKSESYSSKRTKIELAKRLPIYRNYLVQRYLCEKKWNDEKKYLSHLNKNNDSDVLFFQTPGTAYFFLKNFPYSKKKTILISHADTNPLEQLLLSRKELRGSKYEEELRKRYEFVYRNMDKVITICKSSQKYMYDTYCIKCPVIINGIEDTNTTKRHNKYSKEDGKIHFVSLGNIIKRKGFDILVEAVKQTKEKIEGKAMFHLIGAGKDYREIEYLIKKYGLLDLFVLHGALLDVASELERMDLFIFPTRSDTVPVAIIESLRAGVPVFSTAVGEIPNMINEGAGEVIKANVDSTAKCITSVVNGNYELKRMGICARNKYVEHFTLEKMCLRYAEVINSLFR